jgi:MFS transporter, DHA2 family, multidrug resistance protein
MTTAATMPAQTIVPPLAGRREWLGLAVLALPCLLVTMDLTILNLAVPSLSADLAPSSSQLLWIVDIYGFLVAGSLITMGTLGDRIGRRRLLLAGAAAFGAASVLAAFATSPEMLIAFRALLGVAGATLAPSTLSLIRNMFADPSQRGVAIGVWAASFSAGTAIGPLLGGILLEHYWWGSAFLLAVPVMGLLLVLGPRLLPEFRDPEAGRLDVISAAMSLASVLAVIYGLKHLAQDGVGSTAVLSIVVGLTVGVAFVRRQGKLADPFIDVQLFRVPSFATAMATNTVSIFVALGSFIFIAQYFQLVVGLSPFQAGLWTLPSAVALITGSMVAPLIVRRVSAGTVVGAGLATSAFGFAVLTQVDASSGLTMLVVGDLFVSLGVAAVVTLGTDLIVGSAPPERSGAASALSETSTELGGALGIALLGTIGTAVYRADVREAIPAGLPPETAAEARETLGGALAAANHLPDQLGTSLVDAARESFTNGLQLTAMIAGAIAAAVAVLAVVMLRGVRSDSQADAETDCEDAIPCFEYAVV